MPQNSFDYSNLRIRVIKVGFMLTATFDLSLLEEVFARVAPFYLYFQLSDSGAYYDSPIVT